VSVLSGQDDMEGADEATTSLTRTTTIAGKNRVKLPRYILIVTNDVFRIETSYLRIKCTKPSYYSLHRYSYFPKHACYKRYKRIMVTRNE
jgi:hypothetical protein